MISQPRALAISPHRIDPATRPAYVSLRVGDLGRQVLFYQKVLGLRLHWRRGHQAALGAGADDLVRLRQVEQAKRYRGVTGLYHFALLFPSPRQLAKAVARLFAFRWPNSPTDHVMTKTTYLEDAEGNLIELYCESPEDGVFMVDERGEFVARHRDGRTSDGREHLDLKWLFSHLEPGDRWEDPIAPEVRMGHFHLHVANLEEARRFYHEQLGFDDMGLARRWRMGMVSAGEYHHHIGYNTWQGEGAPPPPEDALGLEHIAFDLPSRQAEEALLQRLDATGQNYRILDGGVFLRDPSQNGLLFRVRPEA